MWTEGCAFYFTYFTLNGNDVIILKRKFYLKSSDYGGGYSEKSSFYI